MSDYKIHRHDRGWLCVGPWTWSRQFGYAPHMAKHIRDGLIEWGFLGRTPFEALERHKRYDRKETRTARAVKPQCPADLARMIKQTDGQPND